MRKSGAISNNFPTSQHLDLPSIPATYVHSSSLMFLSNVVLRAELNTSRGLDDAEVSKAIAIYSQDAANCPILSRVTWASNWLRQN